MYLVLLFVFFARVSDVTLSTLRILMLMRGKTLIAAVIGFFEVSVYILALGQVLNNLNHPISIVVYALGFATGNIVGGFFEEKLAVGYNTAQVISVNKAQEMAARLRDHGFGVTIIEGCGIKGPHDILYVLLKRRDLPSLMAIIQEVDKNAFVSIMDTRKTFGGYFSRIKAK